MVCEYKDIFLDELPELPPYRDVDFTIELHLGTFPISMNPHKMAPIELHLGTFPISMNPHKMAPIELQELKVQL